MLYITVHPLIHSGTEKLCQSTIDCLCNVFKWNIQMHTKPKLAFELHRKAKMLVPPLQVEWKSITQLYHHWTVNAYLQHSTRMLAIWESWIFLVLSQAQNILASQQSALVFCTVFKCNIAQMHRMPKSAFADTWFFEDCKSNYTKLSLQPTGQVNRSSIVSHHFNRFWLNELVSPPQSFHAGAAQLY